MTQFRELTWGDFDQAATWLAQHLTGVHAAGIFGEPRGGLPLAVTLSHRLSLPYFSVMRPGAIWVDDIVDTGHTRDTIKDAAVCAAWFTRHRRDDVLAAEVCAADEWLIFPWCLRSTAEAERLSYMGRRGIAHLSGAKL